MPRQHRGRNKVTQETKYDSPAERDTGDAENEAAAEAEVINDEVAAVQEGIDEAAAEAEAEVEAEPPQADDEAARRMKVIRDAPYRAEGFNVYDGRNNRVVICGNDDNRAASGPGLALLIASVFNRIAGGH